jgi:hypothetical protein
MKLKDCHSFLASKVTLCYNHFMFKIKIDVLPVYWNKKGHHKRNGV